MFKIWDWTSLVGESCKYIHALISADQVDGELTGGTIWTRNQKPESQIPDPRAQNQPRHIPVLVDGKPYDGGVQAVRVSADGFLGALVLETMEVLIYKFIESEGNLVTEKLAKKPKKTIKVTYGHFKKAIDLFIFKQKFEAQGTVKYHMYLLFENGILLIEDIVEQAKQTILLEDTKENAGIHLSHNCADIDYEKGLLLVDISQKTKDREEHYVRQYHYQSKPPYVIMNRVLEGTKEKLRFFRHHIVEVKTMQKGTTGQKGSEMFVQDLANDITVFWQNKHNKILEVEIEKDAIFYLAENVSGSKREKVLCKLFEMEDNIKI